MTKVGDCEVCHDTNQANYYAGKKKLCKKHFAEKNNARLQKEPKPSKVDDVLEEIDSTLDGFKSGMEEITIFVHSQITKQTDQITDMLQSQINKQNEELRFLKDKIVQLLEQNRQIIERITVYESHARDVTAYQVKAEEVISHQIEEVVKEIEDVKETCCDAPKTKSLRKSKKLENNSNLTVPKELKNKIPEYIKYLREAQVNRAVYNTITVEWLKEVSDLFGIAWNSREERNKTVFISVILETLKTIYNKKS